MARYEHLQLERLPERFERRKHGGGGPPPERDPTAHTGRLRNELDAAVEVQRQRRRPEFIDPSLILRVRMSAALLEEEWEQLGLTVLSTDADRTLVLFASSEEMREFRERLDAYARGAQPGRKHPPYSSFVGTIEEIGAIEPSDRIGLRLRESGFNDLDDFVEDDSYLLDVELWDLGRRELRNRKLDQISEYVRAHGGDVLDSYVGPSITMLRIRTSGSLVRALLAVEEIAVLDLPPEADADLAEVLELAVADLPELAPIDANAPVIGVIDSGINVHPLFEGALVGSIGVPQDLGTADEWGHGTRVSGVAIFGDVRAQLAAGTLIRGARLCAAKVVNEQGRFDERRLVPSQMREAITTLHAQFGCRIFVVALGDVSRPYDGGKVGTWAATLDELAREHNVLIIVSAGNRQPRGGTRLEQAVTEYPNYLLEAANRLLEPASAMNVLTVGSLAHSEGLDPERADDVRVRPITRESEPSPFTRIGPGIGDATKPELVDIGGTMVFDPVVGRLRKGEDLASAGVLTLNHRYIDRLFTTGSGTSYSAPLVAFKASQILARFPNASANLLRALLIGSASLPPATTARLEPLGREAARAICGHGQVDLERAAYSDDARVVLYAEDELAVDHFAVYQVPIPDLFQEAGRRSLRVTLAFDPPVRHTRSDYPGIGMSFRLVRGCDPGLVFEHFRKRAQEEGRFPEIAARFNCSLEPGPRDREKSTVQTGSISFSRGIEDYGNQYYLVVRCEGGWASNAIDVQRFAVVVEMTHQAEVRLYERLRQRIRLPG